MGLIYVTYHRITDHRHKRREENNKTCSFAAFVCGFQVVDGDFIFSFKLQWLNLILSDESPNGYKEVIWKIT